LTRKLFEDARARGVEGKLGHVTPLKRSGRAEEIAAAAAFLASDDSSYVDRQSLSVEAASVAPILTGGSRCHLELPLLLDAFCKQAYYKQAYCLPEIRGDTEGDAPVDFDLLRELFRAAAQPLVQSMDAIPAGEDDNPDLDRMVRWLSERVPESETLSLCHGDFRIANAIFHKSEPRVIGVVDWELSRLGHPLVDLAFNSQAWRVAPHENGGLLGLPLTRWAFLRSTTISSSITSCRARKSG
jgi:hypothetical protein